MGDHIKKILIIRFSSIGDLVLISPVLRCIKEQLNAEIHLLVREKFRFVHEANPNIDKQIPFNENLFDAIQKLKNERYDYILDLQNNFKSLIISAFLFTPVARLNKINIRKLLAVLTKSRNILPQKHIVDRMFEASKKIGVINDGKGLEYYIPEIFIKDPPAYGILSPYIALIPGGSYGTKQIPVEIINKILQKNTRVQFVLLGDHADAQRLAELRSPNMINLCGRIHFHESAYILSRAAAVITSDTGLMHVASAFQKKIYSLWGNTIPEFGMAPYNASADSKILEVKGLWCRPCSKLGYKKCPLKHFKCMKSQDIEKINL
ncbi:MAG: glycosyltransferase family 9 protein [Bacteroidia bacterium]|nr:glycosyltransferase family 9 protein [Bacteroidia bacterium]